MGYRSQVAIALNKKAFWKHVGEDITEFKDCDQILEADDNVTFVWEHVKWYPSYEGVKAVMRVVAKVNEDNDDPDGDDYGFLRIGEEESDIEREGSPWDFDMSISTSMSVEGEEVEKDKFFTPNSIKFIKEDD